MQVSEGIVNGLPVIAIQGELDRSNVASFEEALAGHVKAEDPSLILDLSACSFIDSGGLAAILWARKEMGGERVLAFAGADARVRRLLEIIGLLQIERVEEFVDVRAAVTALSLAV
jgi:anti-anti-sigma factor